CSSDLIFARSSTVYISQTLVIAIGWNAPAPNLCIKRKITSINIELAKPHKIDPIKKIKTPIINIGFLPNKSDNFPKIIVVTAFINKNDENTQLYNEKPPRSPTILGIAVATIVPSIAAINIANYKEIKNKGRTFFFIFSALKYGNEPINHLTSKTQLEIKDKPKYISN